MVARSCVEHEAIVGRSPGQNHRVLLPPPIRYLAHATGPAWDGVASAPAANIAIEVFVAQPTRHAEVSVAVLTGAQAAAQVCQVSLMMLDTLAHLLGLLLTGVEIRVEVLLMP